MGISQLLPDLGGWCFKFQGSINPEEIMLLPSFNYFCLMQDGGIKDG